MLRPSNHSHKRQHKVLAAEAIRGDTSTTVADGVVSNGFHQPEYAASHAIRKLENPQTNRRRCCCRCRHGGEMDARLE